jgi:hypothetical protein
MADVVDLEAQERDYVRFFRNYVDCDWCGMQTRGRVYEETQTIVCSACRKPLLEIDEDVSYVLTLEED